MNKNKGDKGWHQVVNKKNDQKNISKHKKDPKHKNVSTGTCTGIGTCTSIGTCIDTNIDTYIGACTGTTKQVFTKPITDCKPDTNVNVCIDQTSENMNQVKQNDNQIFVTNGQKYSYKSGEYAGANNFFFYKNHKSNFLKKVISNEDFESDDNENLKKILCQNIVFNGECKYGDNCSYAHNLSDQNISSRRKNAYSIIKGDFDLSNINLEENEELYRTLLELTRYCKNCNNNQCIGGYNCKSGSCSKKYCVCINDIKYGDCHNPNCSYLHLSTRGLNPYYNERGRDNCTDTDKNEIELILSIQNALINDQKNFMDIDMDVDNDDCSDVSNTDVQNNTLLESNDDLNMCDKIKNDEIYVMKIKSYKGYINLICNRSIF
jgi:hypothetical protein